MKKTLKTYILLGLTGLTVLSACTKDFKEINTDKNGSKAARPEALLTPAIWDVVSRNNTRALRLTNELMQVHVTTTDGDEIHRYVIRPSESDYMWNNWYLQITNFKDMYSSGMALKNKTYMAFGLICDVFTSSLITDTFGDVPYSEANKGKEGILQPKFDTQQSIYTDLFRKLEEANNLLAAPTAMTADQLSIEPLYGKAIFSTMPDVAQASTATTTAWRKFSNSLYLRLLLRASARTESNAIAKINEIVNNPTKYPIISSNAESAVIRYTTIQPFVSPFNTYRPFDFNGDNGLTIFFLNNLNVWGDPRRAKWSTLYEGAYAGIPSGYPRGEASQPESRYNAALMNEPLLGNIINYAEVQFILAECAVKNYISSSAKTYYENGVNNAITFWGLNVPTNYMANPALVWNDGDTEFNKMEKIHAQKYYTLFFTDFQQWFEYRRTGHPVLPKGSGLQNDGNMPVRLRYPVYVQSLNGANYQAALSVFGADDLNTKMWWNK
ncbi:SusD/RagB family nutrient-binding outer membrane lipoprotein [Pedobacter nyackensis]|uniref:SusD/RagB family nutrient-binding outer membrane lipoprotein n=1 Tax=Pedobacter nyackensis TaxID=475255 RepID=UPI00292F9463|nr:SusD/RagB family nutrient-binding outer membrane lipoprotein [Pedobacter nyackensis]